MSITFIGNAIRDFQEAGYITTTQLFGTIPRLDINLAEMTGIHPTLKLFLQSNFAIYLYNRLSIRPCHSAKKKTCCNSYAKIYKR